MSRRAYVMAIGALVSCQDSSPSDRGGVHEEASSAVTPPTEHSGPELEPSVCEVATCEVAAEPVLRTWCTPCHSSSLTGADRSGAPEGLDFDTWERASLLAQHGPRRRHRSGCATHSRLRSGQEGWTRSRALSLSGA